MSGTYLHLILNHVPAIGVLIGLALGAFAMLAKKPDVMKAALGLFVVSAVFAAFTYFTGESAEHAVEGLPGVSEARIEAHEEVAATAAVGAGLLGVLALGALVLAWGKAVRPALGVVVLLVALGVSGLITYTAKLGGEIRHTELLGEAAAGSAAVGVDYDGSEHDDD
ncbi:MAG TPA: hypothetical protein VK002_11230 [Rubricoccaceae bacterium]|jgi:uncharacterized membrane protein|nr:hypothetical protein [Rubricoccaceae bacterium]